MIFVCFLLLHLELHSLLSISHEREMPVCTCIHVCLCVSIHQEGEGEGGEERGGERSRRMEDM